MTQSVLDLWHELGHARVNAIESPPRFLVQKSYCNAKQPNLSLSEKNAARRSQGEHGCFDSMFSSYIWGETRYCGVGGNNRSSIMECITKNETYFREARFVLLCSSSLNLPKCADVQDSSGTSLSNFGEWVWSVLWLMGSIVLTVWREVGSRI